MTTDQITAKGYPLIKTVDDLHYYLKQALKLEHATIPPYIIPLYFLKPGTNLEAFHITPGGGSPRNATSNPRSQCFKWGGRKGH